MQDYSYGRQFQNHILVKAYGEDNKLILYICQKLQETRMWILFICFFYIKINFDNIQNKISAIY